MVKKEMMMVMIVVQAGYGTGQPFPDSLPIFRPCLHHFCFLLHFSSSLHSMIAYFERKNLRPQMSIEFL